MNEDNPGQIGDDTLSIASGDPTVALERNKRSIDDARRNRQWDTVRNLEDEQRRKPRDGAG